jgi:ADP-ribosylglycohydrolase
VVDTLSSAIWSVYNSSSIEEAVLTAVNLGNDADTIASITGTISACKYLGQRMPRSYYNALRNKVILNQYIFKFSDKFEDK